MKTCTIWGDLSSDRASEQYPNVTVCDSCVERRQAKGEEPPILSVDGRYDSYHGEVCHFCQKTKDEEDAERQ
nr:hypothetical protein [uncultured Rhodopila sp.]